MVLIEVIAGLLFMGFVAALVVGAFFFLPRLVNRQLHKHSIQGQIERKQEVLGEQLRLQEEIAQDIEITADEDRQMLLRSHYYIVEKNIELLDQDLKALEQKRDEERLKQSIQRRRLR
jgi:hypothetical protein